MTATVCPEWCNPAEHWEPGAENTNEGPWEPGDCDHMHTRVLQIRSRARAHSGEAATGDYDITLRRFDHLDGIGAVNISLDGDDGFTPAEAREVAAVLLELADVADDA